MEIAFSEAWHIVLDCLLKHFPLMCVYVVLLMLYKSEMYF